MLQALCKRTENVLWICSLRCRKKVYVVLTNCTFTCWSTGIVATVYYVAGLIDLKSCSLCYLLLYLPKIFCLVKERTSSGLCKSGRWYAGIPISFLSLLFEASQQNKLWISNDTTCTVLTLLITQNRRTNEASLLHLLKEESQLGTHETWTKVIGSLSNMLVNTVAGWNFSNLHCKVLYFCCS